MVGTTWASRRQISGSLRWSHDSLVIVKLATGTRPPHASAHAGPPPGGLPGIVEIGVLFDLVIVVAVAAAFTTRIHDEFGTGDTTMLESLRD